MIYIPALDEFVTDECNCNFTPYDDGDGDESCHYKRRCASCHKTWFGLHCPHDLYQNACPHCGAKPVPVGFDRY